MLGGLIVAHEYEKKKTLTAASTAATAAPSSQAQTSATMDGQNALLNLALLPAQVSGFIFPVQARERFGDTGAPTGGGQPPLGRSGTGTGLTGGTGTSGTGTASYAAPQQTYSGCGAKLCMSSKFENSFPNIGLGSAAIVYFYGRN